MKVLEVNNIVKVYGGNIEQASTKALNYISFTIEKGEFVGIMGPSGSGKTTLLNILSGIDKAISGYVKISGDKISDMTNSEIALYRRKHMGFVFQDFNLLDSLSLKENVLLPLVLDNKTDLEAENKAYEIMKLFGVETIGNKYPYNVSGGQQQRIAVSRAIVNDPDIVFADEPTGNLDSQSSKDIMECFEKMNKEKESTILVVTHDVFAASYCNRVIFIKDGMLHSELNKKGTRREFLNQIMDSIAIIGGERYDL